MAMVWTETMIRSVWRCGPYRVARDGKVFVAYVMQLDGLRALGKRTSANEAKRVCRRHAERNKP